MADKKIAAVPQLSKPVSAIDVGRTPAGITPLYVKARDAALMLGMGESWFWEAVHDGKMPAGVHFGKKATRWKISDVLAAADANFGGETAGA